MTVIGEIGTEAYILGNGVGLGPRIIHGAYNAVLLPDGTIIHPLSPYTRVSVAGTALANNASATIIANATPYYNIIRMLSLEVTVTGKYQFLVGTDIIFRENIVQNITNWIPIPDEGLIISDPASDFKLKNVSGSGADYVVNVSWSNIGPLG